MVLPVRNEVVIVFLDLAYKALTPPGIPEADALSQVWDWVTDPSVETADWMHRKSSYHLVQMGWRVAKDARLLLKYSDSVKQ